MRTPLKSFSAAGLSWQKKPAARIPQLLEFAALIALRIKAPKLERPYRVPLGSAGPWIVTAGPTLMIVLAVLYSGREQIAGLNAFLFGALVMLMGILLYPVLRFVNRTLLEAKEVREG